MHGTLRFFLALLVALSHLGAVLPSFNQGVFAVVIFYMLAGGVSYKLLTKYYQNQPLAYYKDRFKRIYPLYLLALCVAVIAYFLGASSPFLAHPPTITDAAANLTIIPLAYYMYTNQDAFTLLPPAWSLGVEVQFYLLIPFILQNKKLSVFLFCISLALFCFATVGILNTDIFGYRLIAGVLFIFLTGLLIEQAKENAQRAKQALLLLYLLLILLFVSILSMHYKALYNYETLTALLLGIPLLLFIKPKLPKKLDSYLGELSYTLFLLHFPVMWLSKLYYSANELTPFFLLLLTLLLSSLLNLLLKLFLVIYR